MKSNKDVIIIIDDDQDLLNLLTASFKTRGFNVSTFTRGADGLAFLLDEKNIESAALIILDRLLPDMEGLHILTEFLKKFPDRVPVLILSVLSSEQDVLAGIENGAVDYMTKPFTLPTLMVKALALIGS